MKIIFLDIDGVLNTVQGDIFHTLHGTHIEQRDWTIDIKKDLNRWDVLLSEDWCPVAVSNLTWLLKVIPDARIVLCSTWRSIWPKEIVKGLFVKYPYIAARVIDRTPHMTGWRGREVKEWLRLNSSTPEDYLIIDDDMDFFEDQKMKQVCPDAYVGFNYHNLLHAVKILGGTPEDLGNSFFDSQKTPRLGSTAITQTIINSYSEGNYETE